MDDDAPTVIRLPGNVNSIYIIVSAIAVFAGQWYLYGYRLDDVAKGMNDLRVGSSLVSTQIQSINVSIGQHDVEIRNLQDSVTELRRQARIDTRGTPPEFLSPNGSRGLR